MVLHMAYLICICDNAVLSIIKATSFADITGNIAQTGNIARTNNSKCNYTTLEKVF